MIKKEEFFITLETVEQDSDELLEPDFECILFEEDENE